MPSIVFITTVANTHYILAKDQYRFLTDNGFDIYLIARADDYYFPRLLEEGFDCHSVDMKRKISPFRDIRSILQTRKILRNIKPDMVVSSTPKAGLLGSLAAALAGIKKRVFMVRGILTDFTPGFAGFIIRYVEKLSAMLASDILVVSQSNLDHAVSTALFSQKKALVPGEGMSNGIDTERFNPENCEISEAGDDLRRKYEIHQREDGGLVLLNVSRLGRDKGISELYKSWLRLKKKFDKLHMILVGGWDKEWKIPEQLKQKIESDARIHLAGRVRDVEKYYAAADLVVFPSYREGFPNVVMEAGAMKVPVVAFDACGTKDSIISGETGILVPVGQTDKLVDECAALLQNEKLRTKLGNAARERVLKSFTNEIVWNSWKKAFTSILQRDC